MSKSIIDSIVFGLRKISAFSLKEINLIKSQNISVVLIFLYPIIAVVALAFALSGASVMDVSFGAVEMTDISLGVVLPEVSQFFDSNSFRAELNSFDYLEINEFESEEELSNAIKNGKIIVGIIISSPEFTNDFIKAKFLYDDSSFLASGTILAQVKTAINSIGFKKSSEILTNLLENLDTITANLDEQSQKTDEIILQLNSTNDQLLDLNQSIHSIDTNEIISKLDLFDEYYELSKQDINTTLEDINEMRENLEGYSSTVVFIQTQINDVLLPLETDLNSLKEIAELANEPEKTILLQIHSRLNDSFQQIKTASIGLGGVVSDLDDMQSKLESARQKLLLASERLDDAKNEIDEFSTDFTKINSLIELAKEVVSSTYDSKLFVSDELENAKSTFNGLMNTLDGIKQFSPEYIVNPIDFEIKPVYGITKVNSMIPASIALILLLTTLLLASTSVIIEKEKGLYYRLKVSPTMHSLWLAGKFLGQMFFALLVSIIILLIAFFGFNVLIPTSMFDLIIAIILISFAFICIGLFIPEIMKTQATAILSSLLILIPMLFLSGMIFPIEFMPFPVNSIASFLPLTVAVKILSAIMIKSVTLIELLPEFAILLIPSLILLVITLLKNKDD